MDRCALALQASAQQIEWVDDARAESTTEGTDGRGCEVRGRGGGVGGGCAEEAGVARDEELLAVFEGGEVDGRVGEHAGEAHGQPAVERADPGRAPHLQGGGGDETVAVEAALDGFALHAAGDGVSRCVVEGIRGKETYNFRVSRGYIANLLDNQHEPDIMKLMDNTD